MNKLYTISSFKGLQVPMEWLVATGIGAEAQTEAHEVLWVLTLLPHLPQPLPLWLFSFFVCNRTKAGVNELEEFIKEHQFFICMSIVGHR